MRTRKWMEEQGSSVEYKSSVSTSITIKNKIKRKSLSIILIRQQLLEPKIFSVEPTREVRQTLFHHKESKNWYKYFLVSTKVSRNTHIIIIFVWNNNKRNDVTSTCTIFWNFQKWSEGTNNKQGSFNWKPRKFRTWDNSFTILE